MRHAMMSGLMMYLFCVLGVGAFVALGRLAIWMLEGCCANINGTMLIIAVVMLYPAVSFARFVYLEQKCDERSHSSNSL